MEKDWGQLQFVDGVGIRGRVQIEVTRARPDGKGWLPTKLLPYPNLVVNNGMDYLASRIGSRALGTNSTMTVTAIGTVSTAATLTDASLTGEVDRKLFDSTSLNANTWVRVNTWGGGADGVTSVIIVEAGVFNSDVAATGIMFQRFVFAQVVLADSDFLKIQIETQVGSR